MNHKDWDFVNRRLVAKMLSEMEYEQVFHAESQVLLCLEMIVWSVASAVPQRAVKTIKRINDFHRGLKTGRKNG